MEGSDDDHDDKEGNDEGEEKILLSASGRPLRKVQNKNFGRKLDESIYSIELGRKSQRKSKRILRLNEVSLKPFLLVLGYFELISFRHFMNQDQRD